MASLPPSRRGGVRLMVRAPPPLSGLVRPFTKLRPKDHTSMIIYISSSRHPLGKKKLTTME